MIRVPTFSGESDFTQTLTLGGQEVTIRMAWNSRSEHWYGDFTLASGEAVYSRKLSIGIPLFRTRKALFPLVGDFVLMPERADVAEYPGYSGLGDTHNLYYLDASEVVDLEAFLGIQ